MIMPSNPNIPEVLEWEANESLHGDRTIDWFWGVGLVGAVIGITAIVIGNFLLVILALVGTAALIISALKHPQIRYYALTPRGLIKDEILYPWSELEVFWILDYEPAVMLVKSKRSNLPLIEFPIPETVDPDLIHDYMFQHLDDEPLRIGTAQSIMNRLGFY
jgi:hypothetical protein